MAKRKTSPAPAPAPASDSTPTPPSTPIPVAPAPTGVTALARRYALEAINGTQPCVECGRPTKRVYCEHCAVTDPRADDGAAFLRMERLRVPALYAEASVNNYRPFGSEENRQHVLAMRGRMAGYLTSWPDVPSLLVFMGPSGVGKTHLAWAAARHITSANLGEAKVVRVADMVRHIREAWKHERSEASERQRLAEYLRPDLLVLDELSGHALLANAVQHLYDVLAPREERHKPTIITTNATNAHDLRALVGPAVADRLMGSGGIWMFPTESYREWRVNQCT